MVSATISITINQRGGGGFSSSCGSHMCIRLPRALHSRGRVPVKELSGSDLAGQGRSSAGHQDEAEDRINRSIIASHVRAVTTAAAAHASTIITDGAPLIIYYRATYRFVTRPSEEHVTPRQLQVGLLGTQLARRFLFCAVDCSNKARSACRSISSDKEVTNKVKNTTGQEIRHDEIRNASTIIIHQARHHSGRGAPVLEDPA